LAIIHVVTAITYDENTAKTQVKYAAAAYCGKDQIQKWSCTHCNGDTQGFIMTLYFTGMLDVEGYLGYNPKTATIEVVYRGTSDPLNWLDDLMAFDQVSYPGVSGALVHKGFYNTWLSLNDTITKNVQSLKKSYPSYTVYITGHSLGAAIATFNALSFQETGFSPVVFYDFGSPRVGNQKFANYFATKVANPRVVHYNDCVPQVPPEFIDGWNYWHVAYEIWYNMNQSSYKICNSSGEDPSCQDSLQASSLDCNSHLDYLNETLGGSSC